MSTLEIPRYTIITIDTEHGKLAGEVSRKIFSPAQTIFLDTLIRTFSHNNNYIIGYIRVVGSIKSFTKPPQLRDILCEVLCSTRHSTTLANVVQESNQY